MKKIIFNFFVLLGVLSGCAPKEPVVFKNINNLSVDLSATGKPLLKADALFFNPNSTKMKLKEVNISVWVDGVPSAEVIQKLDVAIPAKSDFSVPLEVQLMLKETNLLSTVLGFLGGKKYELLFKGHIRVGVHGLTLKVPVAQKQEIKLNH
ncbi:MAG: hypothetical protein JST69_06990 [Bacteroidetes bacterium]|nr:hypothetical protein [Bacteroidota bacterium]